MVAIKPSISNFSTRILFSTPTDAPTNRASRNGKYKEGITICLCNCCDQTTSVVCRDGRSILPDASRKVRGTAIIALKLDVLKISRILLILRNDGFTIIATITRTTSGSITLISFNLKKSFLFNEGFFFSIIFSFFGSILCRNFWYKNTPAVRRGHHLRKHRKTVLSEAYFFLLV